MTFYLFFTRYYRFSGSMSLRRRLSVATKKVIPN